MFRNQYRDVIESLDKSNAVIEFKLNGVIISANKNFCDAMGYQLKEIQGQHHSIFVDKDYAQSDEYKEFWGILNSGEHFTGEYKRFDKNGREVWISASYNPVKNATGKIYKIIKYATDVTAQKLKTADFEGQLDAISKAQAVIEFNLDGTIITANENFLQTMGYGLDEIQGQRHKMFAESGYADTDEYKNFWDRLNRGEHFTGEYKRISKSGKEVWISASYNPIFDMNGKPFKVVKYATDVTAKMAARLQLIDTGDLTKQAEDSVQNVAASVEEMVASVSEISQSMARAQSSVEQIVQKTTDASQLTTDLQDTSKEMENVVSLIRDIAEQVNLLALNATIEAARAGEAGKGFAVVAGEVKKLATETAKATDKIADEIVTLQNMAQKVNDSMISMSETTSNVGQSIACVATAVDEQTSVTQDVGKNMSNIADAVSTVSERIQNLNIEK